ncbi:MAG: DUF2752 domain-containing protein, partial [Sedimentisphaerales bacterium]|nr:DUF2752 domain-containing protein [Sedimentisphaerales bacterium]
THEQLGRPACGFLEHTGYPCPTCGMTTAFSYVLHGRILLAFTTQPAGALGALACMVTAVGGMYYALTARAPARLVRLIRLVRRRRFWLAGLGLLLAAWLWCCLRTAIQMS